MEGVGVKLRRAFGFGDAGPFDREPGRRTCTVAL